MKKIVFLIIIRFLCTHFEPNKINRLENHFWLKKKFRLQRVKRLPQSWFVQYCHFYSPVLGTERKKILRFALEEKKNFYGIWREESIHVRSNAVHEEKARKILIILYIVCHNRSFFYWHCQKEKFAFCQGEHCLV